MKKSMQSFMVAGALLLALAASASGRVAIVSEHRIAEDWTPESGAVRVPAGYPVAAADKSHDVCVNIGFTIRVDGKTADFVELKSWSSATPDATPARALVDAFVQSAAAAVSTWRFVPVKSRPRSVYTSASFVFDGGRALTPETIRGHCRIADLAAFVARARDQDSRRESARGRAERPLAGAERYANHPDQVLTPPR